MTYRDTRSSYPPTAAAPYPTSPTRSSLPFEYSTARPPTGFSEVETAWSQPTGPITAAYSSPPPPVPKLPSGNNPFDGDDVEHQREEEEEEEELYARSDWESSGGKTPGTGSAWSRSSWAGPTTGGGTKLRPPLPLTARSTGAGGLEGIMEDEEWTPNLQPHQRSRSISYHDIPTAGGTQGVEYVYGQGGIVDSPAQITPIKYPNQNGRRSMAPSVLELDYLQGQAQRQTYTPDRGNKVKSSPLPDPITDIDIDIDTYQEENGDGNGNTRYRKSYNAQTTPELLYQRPQLGSGSRDYIIDNADDGGYKYMTPESHQKLGRMSVAPARYTLPALSPRRPIPNPNPSNADVIKSRSFNEPHGKQAWLNRLKTKWLTYRIFINPIFTLISALLLTISNTTSEGLLATWIKVNTGVFDVSRAGDGGVSLGIWGWCPVTATTPSTSTCQAYTEGDFANSTGDFIIPDSSTLSNLSSLLIALTCFTCFLSIYQLITSFFHYYLSFILSLPLSHFGAISTTPFPAGSLAIGGEMSADESRAVAVAVAEVDLRVKCERPPFDYAWVWWCWWAHRRSPLGYLWAVVVDLLAIATFITAFLFKKAIIKGTNTSSSNVAFGGGAYVPILIIVLTLDTTISAMRYFASLRFNWRLFTIPPSPSAAAILIPASEKPLHHFRRTNLSSFFAPRQTTIDQNHLLPVTPDGDIPPVPQLYGGEGGSEKPVKLDEETIRWLAAYPQDEELVPLISSLRTNRNPNKQENEDFLLSEVGLLYLRPESNSSEGDGEGEGEGEGEGVALLVPPKGMIRKEILEDTHLDPIEGLGAGHNDLRNMMAILSKTFWWNGLGNDVRDYIDNCKICNKRKRIEEIEIEARTGMTEVPFTGITDWIEKDTGWRQVESAMAIEMAVALRRAQEDAEI